MVVIENENTHEHRRSQHGGHRCSHDERMRLSPMPIELPTLQSLSNEKTLRVLNYIVAHMDKFEQSLNTDESGTQCLELMIQMLNKVIQDKFHPENLRSILRKVNNSMLFNKTISLITQMCNETSKARQETFSGIIDSIIQLLSGFLEYLPQSYERVTVVISSLRDTVDELIEENVIDESFIEKMKDLKTKKKEVGAALKKGTVSTSTVRFLDIPIIPNNEDFQENAARQISPNVIDRAYESAEQYLDVQYTLLREDFVRPLREGILCLQAEGGQEPDRRTLRNLDIRVYGNVRILYPTFNMKDNTIMYTIQLENRRLLRRINWMKSKRFNHGSLLCLSRDSFQTMFFATVAGTDKAKLSRGLLDVHFESTTSEQLHSRDLSSTFKMVESSAYFVAYRHNLSTLKEFKDHVPFDRYIVKCNSDIQPPRYLLNEDDGHKPMFFTFDNIITGMLKHIKHMQSEDDSNSDTEDNVDADGEDEGDDGETLTTKKRKQESKVESKQFKSHHFVGDPDCSMDHDNPEGKDSSDVDEEEEGEIVDDEDGDKRELKARTRRLKNEEKTMVTAIQRLDFKHCRVLDSTTWPSADLLGLDESQYEALKLALTKEFALIQGPPGTGKTYLGLKIVQMLLKNRERWSRHKKPVLIVCYTNHALDQFLEGIRQFEPKGIVRVGGRSKSDALKACNLNEIKWQRPRRQDRGLWRRRNDLKRDGAAIVCSSSVIRAMEEGILSEKHLNLSPAFKEQIKMACPTSNESCISSWLEVKELKHRVGGNRQDNAEDDRNYIDVEDEAHFFENERMWNNNIHGLHWGENVKPTISLKDLEPGLQPCLGKRKCDHVSTDHWVHEMSDVQRRRFKSALFKELYSEDKMTPEEVYYTGFIWNLSVKDRWRLYRFWISELWFHHIDIISTQERPFMEALTLYKELQNDEDVEILQNSSVIGITTTGAARMQSVLSRVTPQVTIIEEAAEIMEAHLVTSLTDGCEHVILIGDHKQLRPKPNVYDLGKNYNLDVSLFERMIKNKLPCVTLSTQHRMRPEIASLIVPHIYDSLLNHASVLSLPDIKGVKRNLFFIDHDETEDEDDENKSHSNTHEARFLANLCRYLLKQGYHASQITILTAYSGQLFRIREFMPRHEFEGVKVTCIDNFQGEENDIILLSLVRSNRKDRIGFIANENRMCVALSRARRGFYCIGNFKLLSKCSKLWASIVRSVKERGYIGTELELVCQNHPDTITKVGTLESFKEVEHGGCNMPCEYRLDCGHVCRKHCHIDDINHTMYICKQECGKPVCDAGHLCKDKCSHWGHCGVCMVPVEKKMLDCDHFQTMPCSELPIDCKVEVKKTVPTCGHSQMVPCSLDPSDFCCQEPCPKTLDCGHKCRNKCGHSCSTKCKERLKRTLKCGHEQVMECSEDPHDIMCKVKCTAILECEHPCTGTCGKCREGRLHERCKEKCTRILVCGHSCTGLCDSVCPPCKSKCENRCVHSRCPKLCGETCTPCKEKCDWKCQHYKCTTKCSSPCIRKRCNEACPKTKACGHPCIGMCGERCPSKCLTCDKDEVCEIFFGDEDEPGARFVELEDCGHVLEVKGLDRWMDMVEEDDDNKAKEIQLKACPKCKTPIRRNLRYGDITKKLLQDIENVKKIINGDVEKCDMVKNRMRKSLPRLYVDGNTEQRCKKRIETLTHKKSNVSLNSLTLIETQLTHLRKIVALKTSSQVSLCLADEDKKIIVREARSLRDHLFRITALPHYQPSQQQMREAWYEILRIEWLLNICSLKKSLIGVGILKVLEKKEGAKTKITDLTTGFQNQQDEDDDDKDEDIKATINIGSDSDDLTSDQEEMKGEDVGNDLKVTDNDVATMPREDIDSREEMKGEDVGNDLKVTDKDVAAMPKEDIDTLVTSAIGILSSCKPFTETQDERIAEISKKLKDMVPGEFYTEITREERQMVASAMKFSRGHWFKCPNGHIYCIGECGGAMQEASCPECGANIGGMNHRLVNDNQLASEMDGARHAAWSEQANLGNYQMDFD